MGYFQNKFMYRIFLGRNTNLASVQKKKWLNLLIDNANILYRQETNSDEKRNARVLWHTAAKRRNPTGTKLH